jgi:hypothetical protein
MDASEIALLTIRKESVALGRLNEQVPPTPFVVRLLETSEIAVSYRGVGVELPWVAMEYVHGGTLEERVAESVTRSGYAFDPDRAAACVEALASGLNAIHEVGVIHRDIKPSNILCCGTGRGELFKIADFGVSRSRGLKQTFAQHALGTPGYAPPEQILMEEDKLGTATDVFALAATTFWLLTGEELFQSRSIADILTEIQGKKRRSIRESKRAPVAVRHHRALGHQGMAGARLRHLQVALGRHRLVVQQDLIGAERRPGQGHRLARGHGVAGRVELRHLRSRRRRRPGHPHPQVRPAVEPGRRQHLLVADGHGVGIQRVDVKVVAAAVVIGVRALR